MAVIHFIATNAKTQELSTDVFPSEDEIFESFLLGEISYDQYLNLIDFSGIKIDSANVHLLDFIPNLTYFDLRSDSLTPLFEREQKDGFLKSNNTFKGMLQNRYSMYLDESPDTRYQHRIQINYSSGLIVDLKLNKEYSGRERFTYRQIAYLTKNSIIRKIILGNYSQRLGLGTAIGYRGKLVDYSRQVDDESFLYPDFGGQNGIYVQLKNNQYNFELVENLIRDSNHSLRTTGFFLDRNINSFNSGIIFSYNTLKNRHTGSNIKNYNASLNLGRTYKKGYTSIEITRQTGLKSASAVVTEGKFNFSHYSIKYAGWFYENNFIDLSGGSKYGSLSNTIEIDHVDFSFSNKRSGQNGGLLKSTIDLNSNSRWSNSILYVSRNEDSLNFQILTELSHFLNSKTVISFDFLNDRKKREIENDITRKQIRLVLKNSTDKFYLRTYLAYNRKTKENDYSSFFINTRWQSQSFLEWEFWFNMGRFNLSNMAVDYWYAFIKNEFTFSSHLQGHMKIAFRYNRTSYVSHRNSITFELNYLL